MAEKRSGVYAIVNTVNGKRYVGSTVDLKIRIYTHRYQLRSNKHHSSALQAAWNKYGEFAFTFVEIAEVGIDEMMEMESRLIASDLSNKTSYNVSANVLKPTLGMKLSEETKRKVSESNKANYPQSRRDAVSAKRKGVKMTDEQRARVKAAHPLLTHCKRGHPMSGTNLYVNERTGGRVCVACNKMTSEQRRAFDGK